MVKDHVQMEFSDNLVSNDGTVILWTFEGQSLTLIINRHSMIWLRVTLLMSSRGVDVES